MLLESLKNGEAKRGFIAKLKEKLPHVPQWLSVEEHVKTAREEFTNLVPPVTPGEKKKLNEQDND